MCTKSLGIFILLCLSDSGGAFLQILQARRFVNNEVRHQIQPTSLEASLGPLLSSIFPMNANEMRDVRENQTEEDLQDEDFLLVPAKPSILVHGKYVWETAKRVGTSNDTDLPFRFFFLECHDEHGLGLGRHQRETFFARLPEFKHGMNMFWLASFALPYHTTLFRALN